LNTDVSGQPFGPNFKGHAVQYPKNVTDRLYRNVGI